MAFHIPDDPFLKDAEGASRFCRDLIQRQLKPKYIAHDFSAAIRGSAKWAAHWAQRSKLFTEKAGA